MKKNIVLWIEQLVASKTSEIPERFVERFSIRTLNALNGVDRLIEKFQPAAIVFDFDYPDRHRLSAFADLKSRHPSVPVLMFTLQHSESLAIWAYRNGALDYVVKPGRAGEIDNCIKRIVKINEFRGEQECRPVGTMATAIPGQVPAGARRKKDKLAPAVFFVQKNFAGRIYSDSVARLCGMSPTHFSRTFRKVYGLTFQDFLLRYRIRQACLQLVNTRTSIAEVAYNVGFSDPSYFGRIFRRFVGVAPSDYCRADDTAANDEWTEELQSSSQIVRALSQTAG